jgi:hypothetical protein
MSKQFPIDVPRAVMRVAFFGVVLLACANAAPAEEMTVPFQLDDNLVRFSATLNGHLANAVLDSGTGAVIVSRDAARRFDLKEGQAIGVADGGGAAAQQLFPTVIDSLAIGPLHLARVSAVTMEVGFLSQSAGFPIDVVVGSPVFATAPVLIDYSARRVTFFGADRAPSCASMSIPIEIVNNVPIATVTLKSDASTSPAALHLIVDLGTRRFAATIGGKFLDTAAGRALWARGKPQQVGTGSGGSAQGVAVNVDGLTIGDHALSDVQIALTRQVPAFEKGFADGTLGVPVWKDGAITFDYPNRNVCLDLRPNHP